MSKFELPSSLREFGEAHYRKGMDLSAFAIDEAIHFRVFPETDRSKLMEFVSDRDWSYGGVHINNLTRAHLELANFAKGSELGTKALTRLAQVAEILVRSLATQDVVAQLKAGTRGINLDEVIARNTPKEEPT